MLRSIYWNDHDVSLYAGQLLVNYGKSQVSLAGKVQLRWSPTPRIEWTGTTNDPQDSDIGFSHRLESDLFPTIQLPLEGALPTVQPRRGATKVLLPPGQFTDDGHCEGLEFLSRGTALDAVVFNLINGPNLLARGVLQDRSKWWLGRWTLDSSTWKVTIDAHSNLQGRVKELTASRGYSFTHVGRLEKTDLSPFDVADASAALDNLFLFLTFVRGSTIGIALPTGFRDNERVWTRWTSGLASSYSGSFSWADPHTTEDITELWPLFLRARSDASWSHALLLSIMYYAEALQARSTEVALTLAQAGLELIGTAVLVDRDGKFAFEKWDQKSAPWRLRKILEAAAITVNIPNECRGLWVAGKLHHWLDAAEAIAAMRNTVTHWSTGKPKVDETAWLDAQRLSLHYLELCILWALNYEGKAFNRLRSRVSSGSSEAVPWSSPRR